MKRVSIALALLAASLTSYAQQPGLSVSVASPKSFTLIVPLSKQQPVNIYPSRLGTVVYEHIQGTNRIVEVRSWEKVTGPRSVTYADGKPARPKSYTWTDSPITPRPTTGPWSATGMPSSTSATKPASKTSK